MILLVFEKPTTMTAYNELAEFVSHKTTFVKFMEGDKGISISFIDAVEDLHVTVNELNYDKSEFEKFKQSLTKNTVFGFVLGIENLPNRPMILPTKPDGKLDIISVAGYIE